VIPLNFPAAPGSLVSSDLSLVLAKSVPFSQSPNNPPPPSDAVRKQKKIILEDLFSSVLSQFKKYHPSGNLIFKNFGIFEKLKIS